MHKFHLPLAFAAIACASVPVCAQYYPAPPPPAYGYGYGHANWQEVRELRMRINGLRRQIDLLAQRGLIGGHAANHLMNDANGIDRRLDDRARDGLDPREVGDIQYRLQRLQQQVQWARGERWDRVRDWR